MVVTVVTDARPDLVVDEGSFALFPEVPLAGEPLRLGVTVRNQGPVASPPAELVVVLVDPDGVATTLAEGEILGAIPAGGEERVEREIVPALPGRHRVGAAVDPAGRIPEVSEANNQAEIAFVVASTHEPVVTIATDRSEYSPGDEVELVAEVLNFAGLFDGSLSVVVEDEAGFLVETVLEAPLSGLEHGESRTVTATWSSAGILAGEYRAVAHLEDDAGAGIFSDAAPFVLAAERDLDARVVTDRATYPEGATVAITGTVRYLEGNTVLSGAEARFALLGSADEEVASWSRPLGDLLPGQEGSLTVEWDSGGAEEGRYRARFEVDASGAELAAETLFDLLSEEPGLEGRLTLSDLLPPIGLPLDISYRVENQGQEDLLDVPLRILILASRGVAELARVERLVDLPASGEVTGEVELDTVPLGLGERLAVLEVEVPEAGGGTTAVSLDVVPFTTVDRTPPEVSVVRPEEGGIVGGDPEVVVRAFDAWSTVDRVEARAAGGGWRVLPLLDAAEGLYGRIWEGLEEGPAEVQGRARDSAGNQATTPWLAFVIDRTPPRITISGVEDGGVYDEPVVPVIEIEEEHPKSELVTLNGDPFTSGTPVEEPGDYLLRVEAEDQAGNRAEAEVAFTLTDDEPELPGLSVHDVAVFEGDEGVTEALFPVTLSEAVDETVQVAYRTLDETAFAGEDYEETTGVLEIPPGETEAEIVVEVLGNELLQPDRTFLVELFDPVDAVLERAVAVGTILDDELCPSPNLVANPDAGERLVDGEIPGWRVVEGEGWHLRGEDPEPIRGEACFFPGAAQEDPAAPSELAQDVDLSAFAEEIAAGGLRVAFEGHVWTGDEEPLDVARIVLELWDEEVELLLASLDSGELAGEGDWLRVTETLEVPEGTASARLRLLATADPLREEGEELEVCFDAFDLRTLRASALIAVDTMMPEGDEGTTDMHLPVRLICPVGWEVRAQYETADGTAIADVDYVPVSGALELPVGETETTVAVPVIGNTIDEPHKHFYVRIEEIEGAAPLKPEAVGLILNDDWCPRSPGYWRNHRQEWPVDELEIGGVLYDEDGIMAFLTYGGPDASTRLARHLTAAELNVARGSKLWILPTLEEAHEFLDEHPPGSDPRGRDRSEANRLKDEIEEFNDTPCPKEKR